MTDSGVMSVDFLTLALPFATCRTVLDLMNSPSHFGIHWVVPQIVYSPDGLSGLYVVRGSRCPRSRHGHSWCPPAQLASARSIARDGIPSQPACRQALRGFLTLPQSAVGSHTRAIGMIGLHRSPAGDEKATGTSKLDGTRYLGRKTPSPIYRDVLYQPEFSSRAVRRSIALWK